jgi:hypothetical protein
MIVDNIPSSTVVQCVTAHRPCITGSYADRRKLPILIVVGRGRRLWVVCSRSEQREGLNPVPIFARFVEARRRRILPLELVTLTYALFRLFWGSLRHPHPPIRAPALQQAPAQ